MKTINEIRTALAGRSLGIQPAAVITQLLLSVITMVELLEQRIRGVLPREGAWDNTCNLCGAQTPHGAIPHYDHCVSKVPAAILRSIQTTLSGPLEVSELPRRGLQEIHEDMQQYVSEGWVAMNECSSDDFILWYQHFRNSVDHLGVPLWKYDIDSALRVMADWCMKPFNLEKLG